MSDEAVQRRKELGAFLKRRRGQLTPADVGLPTTSNRRRAPGLRREEVASLAGVSHSWYTWLEQGRSVDPSSQVIDALARALQLAPDGQAHLRTLAGLPNVAPPVVPAPIHSQSLQRMLDSLNPHPAYIVNQRFDYLAWNLAYTKIWKDPQEMPIRRRNLLWAMFTDPDMREVLPGWRHRAHALTAQLRLNLGPHVADPDVQELITSLQGASAEFRTWWDQHPIRDFKPETHRVDLPGLGPITLDITQLRVVAQPALTLVLQTPADHDSHQRLTALVSSSLGPGARYVSGSDVEASGATHPETPACS